MPFRLSAKVKQSEANVLDAIQDYLSLRGWTHIRTFPGRWAPWGECLAAKRGGYLPRPRTLHEDSLPDILAVKAFRGAQGTAMGFVLWCEVKRPGERPDDAQQRCHERLRAAGFLVIWADGMTDGEGKAPFLPQYVSIFEPEKREARQG